MVSELHNQRKTVNVSCAMRISFTLKKDFEVNRRKIVAGGHIDNAKRPAEFWSRRHEQLEQWSSAIGRARFDTRLSAISL
jgi:hypothetical protein